MNTQLSTIDILPIGTHQYSIIWLHGLGADGHDFEKIAEELHLNAAPNIHFIFPNAPIQAVTINGGSKMRAWYDILEMSLERQVDIAGIYQSELGIKELIEQEINKGISSEHILLAGFSQGGVIALHTGLRYPYKLAGIIGLSTYLPTLKQLRSEQSRENCAIPIFMAHGILDSIVEIETGKAVATELIDLGYSIEWHDYLMEHSVCIEEIGHLSTFINRLFK
ncbi:MAG: carboxylesterase [Methylococcales bacterium]|nr:carboxylesterase [Methylococcales bacterium]